MAAAAAATAAPLIFIIAKLIYRFLHDRFAEIMADAEAYDAVN